MISHIDISDFAVIKNLSLDLYGGLNILTGETGAGKSVIIEAVNLALGGRADTDYIRTGCNKAAVSMVIDTPDDQYVIKREIGNGKSLCKVNGEVVSVGELSTLCKGLVDVHGQYDHQSLLNPDNHLGVLDMYAPPTMQECSSRVFEIYAQYADASSKLMKLRKTLSDAERQKDFLKFEVDEINAANLKPGEDEELEEQIHFMENSETIYESLNTAYEALYGNGNAVSNVGNAMNALSCVKEFSENIASASERISNAYYDLDDLSATLRSVMDSVNFSQAELDSSIERLEEINKLKKKYGGSIDAVLAYAKEASEKLSTILNSDEEMSKLEKTILKFKAEYDKAAEQLSALRKETALNLEKEINKELSDLNFSNAEFVVSFGTCTPNAKGIDTVEFLISANKGELPKPLAKVASGGELSRIMLALKRIIGDVDNIPTMIFDEIDTGISGATAGVVGNKLKSISSNHQIICITHLPQIASKADHHFRIEKTSDAISTQTTIDELSDDERIEEIARLLSGTSISDTARAQAKELILQNA